MRVFVSFTAVDLRTAEAIVEKLRGADFEVFLGESGESLRPGTKFDDRIKAEISLCDVFIFLISPTSITPPRYTLVELGWVRARWSSPRGHVLPVLVTETPFADIPPYLTQTVPVLKPKGNTPIEVLDAVREMKLELEREAERKRLELEREAERKRLEMIRQRRLAMAKLCAAVVALGALGLGIWFAVKGLGLCCTPVLIDAGISHDARTDASEERPRGDGDRNDAYVDRDRPRDTRRLVDCFLDRASGKRCPKKATSCSAPALLEDDEFKSWKKDHENCDTITLCDCLPH